MPSGLLGGSFEVTCPVAFSNLFPGSCSAFGVIERVSEPVGGAEGERESHADSMLSMEPSVRLDLMTHDIMT